MKNVFRFLANAFQTPQGTHMVDDFLAVALKSLAVVGEELLEDMSVLLLKLVFEKLKDGPDIAKKGLNLFLSLATKHEEFAKVSLPVFPDYV